MIKKSNKRDQTLVESYKVIDLLNCLGKVVEKLVIQKILQFCETKKKLYNRQIGRKKYYSSINMVAFVINKVYITWKAKHIADTLFIDGKGTFYHVS